MKLQAATPGSLAVLEREAGSWLTRHAVGIEAVREDGTLAGVVAYDFQTETTARVHVWLDSPIAARPLLRSAFEYPFVQNGVEALLAQIRSDNRRSVALAKALGFTEVYRQRDGFRRGVDLILFQLRRDDCRWLQHRRAA